MIRVQKLSLHFKRKTSHLTWSLIMMSLPLTPSKDWERLNKPQSQVSVAIESYTETSGDLINKENFLQ